MYNETKSVLGRAHEYNYVVRWWCHSTCSYSLYNTHLMRHLLLGNSALSQVDPHSCPDDDCSMALETVGIKLKIISWLV